jgi:hypothetical protein
VAETVTNYFPDPDFRSTRGTSAYVAANAFPNPTPTVDLTHWAAVPGGSITRLEAAALFPENSHGCRVVNGVTLTGANTNSAGQDWTFTGKIKAQTAMTITITGDMLDPAQTFFMRTVGWGDFGWGETTNYLDGPVKTFTAGEECLFRVYGGEQGSGIPGPDHQILLTLSGTGTFDVDGIVQWIGVDDGAGEIPPEWDEIPNAPLYFCGDTPADDNFTYSWYGTPHNSPSLQHAGLPKYAWGKYPWEYSDEITPIADWVFQHETAGGEHRLASRSPIMFGHQNTILAEGITEATDDDNAGLTSLPANTSYVVVGEYITDYQVYHSGYPEPEWACNSYLTIDDADPALTYPANRLGYLPLNGFPPYRLPFMVPFTTGSASIIQIALSTSQNWVTSDLYMTNIGIYQIPTPLHSYDGLDNPVDESQTWSLTAMGVEAGKSYHINAEMWDANGQPIIESRVGEGAWTTLAESTLPITEEPIMLLGEYFDFDVPADATEVRFRLQNPTDNGVGTFDLFEQPVGNFTGDTPDGGGFYYWWEGDPNDSRSIRSTVPEDFMPAIDARVFVDGALVAVEEIRMVIGGTLVPLNQIGTA